MIERDDLPSPFTPQHYPLYALRAWLPHPTHPGLAEGTARQGTPIGDPVLGLVIGWLGDDDGPRSPLIVDEGSGTPVDWTEGETSADEYLVIEVYGSRGVAETRLAELRYLVESLQRERAGNSDAKYPWIADPPRRYDGCPPHIAPWNWSPEEGDAA